ncbi:MAG: class I SAM-dependent methyltransferase [Candidatus Aenigmarchaeota archaeon]|nr:class I SAM-dependent methyltransferase [Candidatus Aenigmarchaeota archaeon]
MVSKLLQYHIISCKYYDNEKELKIIENLCNGFVDKTILEVGCGIGRLSSLITQKGGIYTGLDSNKEFITYCKKKYKGLKFIKSSSDKLPFENEQFDVLLYPWVLPDVKNILPTLREGYRVLKKSGIVICVDGTFIGEYGILIKEFFKKTRMHREFYFKILRDSLISVFRNIQSFDLVKVPYVFPNLKLAAKEIIMELKYLEKLKLTKADEERIKEKLEKFKLDDKVVINETVAFHKCVKL